jgi:hypothetical protein
MAQHIDDVSAKKQQDVFEILLDDFNRDIVLAIYLVAMVEINPTCKSCKTNMIRHRPSKIFERR